MSDSPAQKETIQNLQTECHYLSLALNRTNQKTDPDEYSFLRQKLVNAEEQLAAIAAASAADEEEQTAAIPDDYSFDNEGPAHSDVAAYYAATNSYRQKLRDGARSYKLFAKRSSSSSSSDDRDSDDSSIGSANRHVVRHYRKSLLVEKSRDFLTSNKAKMNTHFKTTPISWVRVILLTTAFIFILIVIIVSNRRASGEFASATLSTEPCATLSISLKTDRFGNETSWDITRHDLATQHSESIIKSGGPYRYGKHTSIHGYTDHMHESICLPVGDYKFILYDEMGDGICCNYGHGQYGLSIIGSRNENSIREVRPMKDGLFLGEEEITSFQITLNDVSGGLEVSNSASSSSSPLSSIGEEDGNNNIGLTTTNATNIEEQTTSNEPPGVSSESWSEKTDDFYLLNDPSNWTMGDDNLLSDDDLIMALETHSDDAVNPLLYQNIEEMDSNSDGKVSSEEYVQGTQEITNYCTVINVQTSFGRRECEKMCGDDHFCCFQPLTQGSYDCREDPSFDCETYKPCEILFDTHPSNELDVAMGDSLVSPSGLTDEEKAIIEEKVYQYCSYGVAGLGIGKCQEICNGELNRTCCEEELSDGKCFFYFRF